MVQVIFILLAMVGSVYVAFRAVKYIVQAIAGLF